MTSAVNTAHVEQRRRLRLESIDQVRAEVQRLVEAEQHGQLEQLGTWSLGQALGHLAAWAEYSFTGASVKVPLFVKLSAESL